MSNLYQDAILDAKALRASAMANAKAALEEAFEPKIQEMISKHLSEEEDEDIEEGYGMEEEGKMHGDDHEKMEEAEDINEAELEEILNQLEEMSAPKEESLNEEAEEKEEDEKEEETEEEEEGEEEEGEDAAEGEEEVGDDTKIIDITLGDLKQVIQSLMPGQEMPAAEEEPTADSEAEAEVSLEEILDELENEGMEEEGTEEEMEEGAEELGRPNVKLTSKVDTQGAAQGFGGEEIFEKKHKLKNPYSKLHNKGAEAADAKNGAEFSGPETDIAYSKKVVKESNELEEAKATIETLRKDLQEVNLLNAKYLYMNKLFKSNSLTESQKLQVINALDRATNVKEVKNTYEVMKESFVKKKSQLKESIGFASKPAGVAPKANIVEADQFISRWQKLAGIK